MGEDQINFMFGMQRWPKKVLATGKWFLKDLHAYNLLGVSILSIK